MERLRKKEEAIRKRDRCGMEQAEKEQRGCGDKFWGLEIVELRRVRTVLFCFVFLFCFWLAFVFLGLRSSCHGRESTH